MSPAKFRALGHRLIDDIADFYQKLPNMPTASPLLPNALREKLGKREMPEDGTEIGPVLSKFSKLFFEESTHNGSPRFWGYITSSAAPVWRARRPARVRRQSKLWRLGPLSGCD